VKFACKFNNITGVTSVL